jgi:hypothetical protein
MSMSDNDQGEGEPLTAADFQRGRPGGDNRREPRYPSNKTIAVRPCRPGEERGFRPASLLDCSVHGLGLFLDESLHAGEQFLVQFKLERMMLAVYTVRHCRRVADHFVVGAALDGFIGGSDDPDAEAILRGLMG